MSIKFKNILVSTVEDIDCGNEHLFGKGFYNEFGIHTALGFEDAKIGDWFHKIGVGLLKKDSNEYMFNNKYEINPAKFETTNNTNSFLITCTSDTINGYSYLLIKKIELFKCHFTITYNLKNTGEKNIVTDEYVHNFSSINNELMGTNYELKFPLELKPELFHSISIKPGESNKKTRTYNMNQFKISVIL